MGVLRAAASPFPAVGCQGLGKEESRSWQRRDRLALCGRKQKSSAAGHNLEASISQTAT